MIRSVGEGRLLQLISIAHGLVGVAVYRRELRGIARERIAGRVPHRGPRATAFWFLIAAPTWWIVGRLLGAAEEAGDERAVRVARRGVMAIGGVGVLCMPLSGFWGLLLVPLRHQRRS